MKRTSPDPFDPFMPLTEAELDKLDRFLISDATSEETLTLSALDGYQTALVIGPTTVMPSRWIPGVWGRTEDAEPDFRSTAQAERIMTMLIRHMNSIIAEFEEAPELFEPMFDAFLRADREYISGEAWAHGFMLGVELVRADWQPLFDSPGMVEVLRPLHLLGSEEVTQEEEELVTTLQQCEDLTLKIPQALVAIHSFWLPYRAAGLR